MMSVDRNIHKNSQSKTMELLAPAGSFPAFEAALEEGADAVYVGAPGFNARALSKDFTFAEIDSMIHQAHRQDVKVYIAMNSLVKESEIPAALEALSCFEQMRPDALIIQDLGLLYLARTWFPKIPLHASTLMSVHNSVAAQELTRLGFERVVLARELTIEEMVRIHRRTGAEIEVFIHGAMCFSYSGLCMFSSLHGGKSSLRGQCVQPCRRHYSWLQPTKSKRGQVHGKKSGASYLFSMNDLCGVDVLPELREAGVSCLKIEGRMKSARYVANTVAAYRMALDCLDDSDEEQEQMLRKAHVLLDEAMARKRSSGYLLTEAPAEAITPEISGSSGQMLGRIKEVRQERTLDGKNRLTLTLSLAAEINEGDRLRLHNEKSGDRVSFTVRNMLVHGRRQKTGRLGQEVQLSVHTDLKGQSSRSFRGSLYKVDVGSRLVGERKGQQRSRKLAGRTIQADRREVESILNQLSWKGMSRERARTRKGKTKVRGRKKGGDSGHRSSRKELPWWVVVAGPADLQQRLPVRAARLIVPLGRDTVQRLGNLGTKVNKFKGKMIWRLPPVIHEKDLAWYGKTLRSLVLAGYFRFELSHCSQYGLFAFLQEGEWERDIELYGHYTLNLLNSAALHGTRHLGFQGVQFSLESEGENIGASIAHFKRHRGRGRAPQRMKVGVYVYGRPPLFTARLDEDHFQYKKPFISPKDEQFTLEHRDGLTLARAILPFSLLKWQQELVTMGADYLVLDLSGGPIAKEAALVSTLLTRGSNRLPVLSGNFQGTLV